MIERWGSLNSVVCPDCGKVGRHYYRKMRKQWRCSEVSCGRYFGVFTGTPFQDMKLSHKKFLFAVTIFINLPNGVSFHSLANICDMQVKTAQVMIGKIREALIRSENHEKMSGFVHMDGGYFGGKPRHSRVRRIPNTDRAAHVNKMLAKKTKQPLYTVIANAKKRQESRRLVFVIRQVSGVRGEGGVRSVVAVADSETESYAMSLGKAYIADKRTVVMTDESPAYNQFGQISNHQTVNHSEMFARPDGVNSNQAESYFSRLRRNEYGVTHRMEPKYLFDRATEMAWREDVRRLPQKDRFSDLMRRIFSLGRSIYWTGYWQGFKRPGEIVWSPQYKCFKVRKMS